MSIRINGINRASTINELSPKHGTYHLADNPNLYEIQRSNNFEFVLTNIDGILRPGMDNKKANRLQNAQEILRLSVTQAAVPHFTQQPIPIRRGNSTLKYAGVPEFNEGQIVINDYIGAESKVILMAWQNLSYNVQTEKVGLVSDYKKDAYLIEYTPDMQIVRQWRLHGCWVSSISEGEFNSDSNEKRTITATIQYDRAEIDTSSIQL